MPPPPVVFLLAQEDPTLRTVGVACWDTGVLGERGTERKHTCRKSLPCPHLGVTLSTWGKSVTIAENLLENEGSLNFRIRRDLEILCYRPFISETKKG